MVAEGGTDADIGIVGACVDLCVVTLSARRLHKIWRTFPVPFVIILKLRAVSPYFVCMSYDTATCGCEATADCAKPEPGLWIEFRSSYVNRGRER